MVGRPRQRSGVGLWRDNRARRGRDYAWAPFETGHTVNLRHGVNHPGTLEPIAAHYATQLLELASLPDSPIGYVAAPEYGPAVQAWATAEAACHLFRVWFSEHGLFEGDGTRTGLTSWDRAEARAAKLRQRLGLDPLSRARLGRDVGAATLDLALLMSEGDDGD